MPEYKYVSSSNVQGVAYDASSQTLYIQFNNGAQYSYTGVPEEEYSGLLASDSPGTYLNDNIKGFYPHQRV